MDTLHVTIVLSDASIYSYEEVTWKSAANLSTGPEGGAYGTSFSTLRERVTSSSELEKPKGARIL
jgi:hypothetical protein